MGAKLRTNVYYFKMHYRLNLPDMGSLIALSLSNQVSNRLNNLVIIYLNISYKESMLVYHPKKVHKNDPQYNFLFFCLWKKIKRS